MSRMFRQAAYVFAFVVLLALTAVASAGARLWYESKDSGLDAAKREAAQAAPAWYGPDGRIKSMLSPICDNSYVSDRYPEAARELYAQFVEDAAVLAWPDDFDKAVEVYCEFANHGRYTRA